MRNATILIGSTLVVLAGTAITPALPAIAAAFADVPSSDFLVRLALTMPSLTIAASAFFTGLLLDRWGRKPVILAALALYAVAGTSGFVVDSLVGILIGRAVLGIAVAGVMSGFTTLIADYFNGPALNRFMGYQGAAIGAGGTFYLLLGGILADIDWRAPFLIHLIALLVIPAVLVSIRETRTESPTSSKAAEGGASASFLGFALVYGAAFAGMLIFFVFPTHLPFYLVAASDISNSQVGLALSVQALAAVVGALLYRRIKTMLSHAHVVALIFLTLGVNHILISLGQDYVLIVGALLIGGLGLGLLPPSLSVWITMISPQAIRGRAVGGLTAMLFLGQFVAPFATQPIFSRGGALAVFATVGIFSLALAFAFGLSRRA